jgi:hypothetical protein
MRIGALTASVAIAIFCASCGGSGDSGAFDPGSTVSMGGSAGAGGSTDTGDSAAAPDTGAGGDAQTEAGPVDTTASMVCGTSSCALANNRVCCVENAASAYECADRGACPTATKLVELRCASDANCAAGSVCCLSLSNGTFPVSQCQTACYPSDLHLCKPKASPSGCETFQTCSTAGITGWGLPAASYGMCK